MMKCSRTVVPLNYSNRILYSALPSRFAVGNGGTSIEHGTVRSTHAKLSLTTASLLKIQPFALLCAAIYYCSLGTFVLGINGDSGHLDCLTACLF